jgi:hypothetical protein
MFGLDFVGKEIDAHFAARQVRRDVWTDENLAEFSSRRVMPRRLYSVRRR